jgi:hypothetical protein
MSAARRLSLTLLGPERNAQGLTGLIFNLLLPFPLGLLKAVCYLLVCIPCVLISFTIGRVDFKP